MRTLVVLILYTLFFDSHSCKDFQLIDGKEFEASKISKTSIVNLVESKKKGHVLAVRCKDTTISFADFFSKELNDYELTYELLGKDTRWALVKAQDENHDYFYLVNLNSGKTDKLAGLPIVYQDKLLCLEGGYTDGGYKIEVWKVDKNKVSKIKFLEPKVCDLRPDKIYLKDNTVYFSTFEGQHYKTKI